MNTILRFWSKFTPLDKVVALLTIAAFTFMPFAGTQIAYGHTGAGDHTFSASVTPTTIALGDTENFTFTVTNTGDPSAVSPASWAIQSFTILVPADFSVDTPSLSVPTGWQVELDAPSNEIRVSSQGSGVEIAPGDSLSVSGNITSTGSSGGSTTWTSRAFKNNSFTPGVGAEFHGDGSTDIDITVEDAETFTLDVTVVGDGDVTSDIGSIDCPDTDCSDVYDENDEVTLTATPDSGWMFDGWTGDCLSFGTSTTCDLTMDDNKDVTATFSEEPILGCTDPEANNYDPEATEDNDSCTYDDPVGEITITKTVTAAGDNVLPTTWSFDFTGDLGDFTLTESSTSTTEVELSGTSYTISEVTPLPDDWFLVGVDCNGHNGAIINQDNSVTINLTEGSEVECEFQNEYRPEIVQEDPWCSFDGQVIDHTADEDADQNDGDPVDSDRRDTSNVEDGPASYANFGGSEGGAWSTDDFFSLGIEGFLVYEFTGSVAVDQPGDDIAIYEITGGNTDTDEKVIVDVSEDGTNWVSVGTFTGDASIDISGTGLSFVKFVRLTDDSAGIQGNDGDGYDVDAIVILNGSCDEEVVTGEVVVYKTVINDDETGTSTVEDFTLMVGSTTVNSGATTTVPVGTYVVSESGPDGYSAIFGGACDADGNVTVVEGETSVCTIENNDTPPTTNGGGGSNTNDDDDEREILGVGSGGGSGGGEVLGESTEVDVPGEVLQENIALPATGFGGESRFASDALPMVLVSMIAVLALARNSVREALQRA